LIKPHIQFKALRYDTTTSELTVECLKLMLEQKFDVIFKID